MAGRPKPNEELEARGTFSRNPKKYADRIANAPTSNGPLGEPPAHLPAPVRAAYTEIANTVPPGVLWQSDRLTVELAAYLLVEVRANPLAVPAARVTRLQSLLGSLGLSPTDRTRVQIAPAPRVPAKSNDTARFFQHGDVDRYFKGPKQ